MMEGSNVTVSNFSRTVKNQRIPATYYDRTGHFPIWNVFRLLHDLRFLIVRQGFFDDDIDPIRHSLYFFSREILQLNVDVARKMISNVPLHYSIKEEVVSCGNSSILVKLVLFIEELHSIAMERLSKLIFVNPENRKPLQLPEWYKAKYKNKNNDIRLDRASVLRPKDTCFKWSCRIRYSDLDENGHLNFVQYYRMAMDCATLASISGHFEHFTLDMCWYPVRSIDVSFLEECFANDEVTVCCWQDQDKSAIVCFVFLLKAKRVFQASFEFDVVPYEVISKSAI